MDWSEAFLRQAKSDYEVFRLLNNSKQPLCHKLHYLQMASEKMAKSFGSKEKPRTSHRVLTSFLHHSKGQPSIRERLGYQNNYNAYTAYIESIMEIASKIENLAPSSTDKRPNPEYPWKSNTSVQCPSEYDFAEFGETELVKFQILLSRLLS